MHLSDAELAALTHGELVVAGDAFAHLETCAECKLRLDDLRAADRLVGEQLRHLDHMAPALRSAAVVARRRWNSARIASIAAALAVLVVGGAAALPNSALHWAVLRAFGRTEHAVPVPPAKPDLPAKAQKTGVSFVAGSSLELRFTNPRPQGVLTIRFVDGSQVAALADGDAGFTVNHSGLQIDDRGRVQSFSVDIPRSIRNVDVVAGGVVVFAKHGEVIGGEGVRDGAGTYTVKLRTP